MNRIACVLLVAGLAGCSDGTSTGGAGGQSGGGTSAGGQSAGGQSGGGMAGMGGSGGSVEPWQPGITIPSDGAAPRGFVDVRGLIHTHSHNSHDACDGEPRIMGQINQECLEDLRRDMCRTGHDFMGLTDHRDLFSSTEFPDTVLYDASRGDELVERDGVPIANRAGCPDGNPLLVLAGMESSPAMPFGLERHPSLEETERDRIYGAQDSVHGFSPLAEAQAMKDAGAVLLTAHTEAWTAQQIIDSNLDGFEMYNVHANLFLTIDRAVQLLLLINQPERIPHPDLTIMPLIEEDPKYIDTWGTVLATGRRYVTTMGTDAHRNTFTQELSDGERVDSFRRMQVWFSNHLLVRPSADGAWDDRDLKDALRSARLYGVFEYLGYAEGFDYTASDGSATYEMGEEITLAGGVTLDVALPRVKRLDPDAEPPELTLRLLRAVTGGWEEVATSSDALSFEVTQPGAYRAEVRMRAHHLREFLGTDYVDQADRDLPWIYSNAIYVVP